ncbi:MAG: arabinogalactan endo-1,4-beta-galactosidase [Prevotella sp.]|jgi:arabinogalactan endo-1,4-beta-galactosidase|nr:arabinogalactan endo-1,4-beta-galactosidase [Prevotella sp.]MCI1282103.1 arabinogalactan endo-1,4-beta-galactosidase [Prevotella sp.]
MKAKKIILVCLTMAFALASQAQKYVGGDISLLTKYVENGATYFDTDGTTSISPLTYFKDQGMNAMRVRIFHNPANATSTAKGQGVIQDLPYVKKLAKDIKDKGFSLLLDFHYSDTWADPSNQWIPKAWLNLTDAALQDSIYNYTKYVLQTLVDEGATPDFIQTGNEISYGMLWAESSSSSSLKKYYAGNSNNATRFFGLLRYAIKACKEVCPTAKVILHTERVPKSDYLVQFYKDMDTAGLNYDIIGLSYYSYYHGDLSVLGTALKALEAYSAKDIWIVEAGYYHDWQPSKVTYDLSSTYPINGTGQKAFTEALIDSLNNHSQVKGLFWWSMESNEHGLDWNTKRVTDSWYNAGLFDNSTGAAEPAIKVLKNFIATNGISNITSDKKVPADDNWYTLEGSKINKPTGTGLYIHGKQKVIVK